MEEEGDALFLPLGFYTHPNILTAEACNNRLTQLPFVFVGNFAWVLCIWTGVWAGLMQQNSQKVDSVPLISVGGQRSWGWKM